MLENVSCCICASKASTVINTCRILKEDADIPEQYLDLVKCSSCGLVYVNPRPVKLEELYSKEYFDAAYMKFYGDKDAGSTQSNEPFDFRLSLIEKYRKSGKFLDVGCATGEFLLKARERGFETMGVEISGYAADIGVKKYGLNIIKGILPDANLPPSSFEVITAGDILEHTPDPKAFLFEIRRLLKDDGILYLAVPNFASAHYMTMSQVGKLNNRNYFILPQHLYQFTPATLKRLLRDSGLDVVETVFTESRYREKGFKHLLMGLIFLAGRIFNLKDRMIIIAKKHNGEQP